jgi:hypothetical protein
MRLKIDHISANSKQNSKKALARESGARRVGGALFDEKKSMVEYLVPLSL